jgi:hypothetical protein
MTAANDPQLEIDRLRVENESLRGHLRAAERECEILHSLNGGRAAVRQMGERTVQIVQIESRERMAMLERTVDILDGFAQQIASYDCYGCEPDSLCTPCRATAALDAVPAWRFNGSTEMPTRRFEGSMHDRVTSGWDLRETKIHRAWTAFMTGHGRGPDHMLGLVLTARSGGIGVFDGPIEWPTPRDWYVATSVVQWLATTVGSSIIESDEDRVAREATRAAASHDHMENRNDAQR